MTARLRTDVFVSALLRNVSGKGGMGLVVRKGFAEAGAVHVQWRLRSETGLYVPAPQSLGEDDGERRFVPSDARGEEAVREAVERELRFDPDAWHVEIEGVETRDVLNVAGV